MCCCTKTTENEGDWALSYRQWLIFLNVQSNLTSKYSVKLRRIVPSVATEPDLSNSVTFCYCTPLYLQNNAATL